MNPNELLMGMALSLNESWQVRLQLVQRLEEAMARIKELEDLAAKGAPEAKA